MHDSFCTLITDHYEGRHACFDFDCKRDIASCEHFKHLLVPETLEKVAETGSRLAEMKH